MNYFLHVNRKLIFSFGLLLILFFILIIFIKQLDLVNVEIGKIKPSLSNADIDEPRFAINNDSKKIFITAKEGNFINKDEILLNKNVTFKSNEFSIETEKVIFDRKNQTAKSETKSLFKSSNTTISSDGFNIYDKGNKIIFFGKSFITLK